MAWLVLMLIVAAIVWLAIRARHASAWTSHFGNVRAQIETVAAQMSKEEALRDFDQACRIVVAQLAAPYSMQLTPQDADVALERAIACRNRVNQLDGAEHGPRFRRAYRSQLLSQLKRAAGSDANLQPDWPMPSTGAQA